MPRPTAGKRQIQARRNAFVRMAREDGPSAAMDRLGVLGVDPSDGRALAELPRWLPADATALYRVPDDSARRVADRSASSNPPGALLAFLRRLAGRGAEPPAPRGAAPPAGPDGAPNDARGSRLAAAVDAAAAERGLPVAELSSAGDATPVGPGRRWIVGAWLVTALSVGAPVGAIARWLLVGGLLAALFAVLASVGAVALALGFAFAHEAAAIRRYDLVLAAAVADAVDADDAASRAAGTADVGARPVLVVPARNAAGVAAILRDRGIDAAARRVDADGTPASVS